MLQRSRRWPFEKAGPWTWAVQRLEFCLLYLGERMLVARSAFCLDSTFRMSPDAWEGVYQIRGEDQIPKSIILQTASSCGVVFGAGLPGGEVANAMDCRSGSKELNLDLLINLDCVVCLGRTTRVFGTAHDMHVCYCCREHPKVRELSAKFRDYARDLKLPLFSITRRSCDQTPSSRIPADSPVLGEFFFFDPQASFALGC